MSCFVATYKEYGECGNSRGISGLVPLSDCKDSIDSHLASLHLSTEKITESQVILARVGIYDVAQRSTEMMVCAKHRHILGKFWRSSVSCQYPSHMGGSTAIRSRYSVNLAMSKSIQRVYGVFVPFGSVICHNCRKYHNQCIKELTWATSPKCKNSDDKNLTVNQTRPCKDSTLSKLAATSFTPIQNVPFGQRNPTADEAWTPSVHLAFEDTMEEKEFELVYSTDHDVEQAIQVFNASMANIADAIGKPRLEPLQVYVKQWETCSSSQKAEAVSKAEKACQLVCDVIAPNNGEALFEAVKKFRIEDNDERGLRSLLIAYQNAPSKPLKTQILSIYANKFTSSELKELHRPFEELSDRQIKKARKQAVSQGAGIPVAKTVHHRIRVDQRQLDHFLDFTMRPYFYQDVAYGTRTIKLESGEELVMPNVVRTVARSTIINQYLQFCKESDFTPFSQSTMWRVLEVQEASQRKSLKGLDNTAADGAEGFQLLNKVVDELEEVGADKLWCSEVREKLRLGKLYLTTSYRDHCKENSSCCPDHCRQFALSDVNDAKLKAICSHDHDMVCYNCTSLKNGIHDVVSAIGKHKSQLGQDHAGDLEYDANAAVTKILEWKAHILRAANQDEAKSETISSLQKEDVFIIVDWAMKFLAVKYREKQVEWFGKRGMNWHVSCVITRESNDLEVTSFIHVINNCQQDWFSVLSILEHLLHTIKIKKPYIKKAYIRSDEAGCYHSSKLVSSLQEMGERQGIQVQRYDHSEPQCGKDACDRILCPLKASMKRYCNEGHDVVCAEDMQVALRERPVRGTTATVCKIQEQNSSLEMKTFPNFSAYHNFQFTKGGLLVWKAFNIGPGKTIPLKKIVTSSQRSTDIIEKVPFFDYTPRKLKIPKTTPEEKVEEPDTLECPEPDCSEVFESQTELDLHISIMDHRGRLQQREGLYDKLKRNWVSQFETLTVSCERTDDSLATMETRPSEPRNAELKMGWALHKRSGATRFSENVRRYLEMKFEIGRKTGRKEDPEQVAKDMRTACTNSGDKLFERAEWLTKTQIRGFFSRLSASIKKGTESPKETEGNEDDDTLENYLNEFDEENIRTTSLAAQDKLGLLHPIVYDIYDICEMAKDNKLATFNVQMLKDICRHYDLHFKSRFKKNDLIKVIEEMVRDQCTCTSV